MAKKTIADKLHSLEVALMGVELLAFKSGDTATARKARRALNALQQEEAETPPKS